MEYSNYDDLVTALDRVDDDIESTEDTSKRALLVEERRAITVSMEAYPLADDDLFRCEQCSHVFDIEDSVKVGDQLICSFCHKSS